MQHDDNTLYWTGSIDKTTLIASPIEKGHITLFSGLNVFNNSHIGHFDHAYILTQLTEGDHNILLIYGKNAEALYTLIYRHFFKTLVAALGLIILITVYTSRRFGLALEVKPIAQRSMIKKLTAIGQFHWLIQNQQQLVNELREDLLKRARLRYPDLSLSDKEQQIKQLSDYCNIDTQTIEYALSETPVKQESSFIATIQALQILRKSL